MSDYKTKGRTALAALCKSGDGQSSLAKTITNAGAPITQSAISAWVRGTSRPEPVMRAVLERVLGISVDDWTTAAERRILSRVEARAAMATDPLDITRPLRSTKAAA